MIRGPFLPGRAAAAAQKPKLHVMATATTVVAAAIITRARVLMETDEEVMPAAHGKFWMVRDREEIVAEAKSVADL